MSTYDALWAQEVYNTYAKLCTRAQQIDACIQQTLDQKYGGHPIRAAIVEALIASIRQKGRQTLWCQYKRLVRRTPLDQDLLSIVSSNVYNAIHEIDVDKKQRQFEFVDTSC